MKMQQSNKILIRVILILATIVAVYYFASLLSTLIKEKSNNYSKPLNSILNKYTVLLPASAETNSWKDYKNSFLSFKYPSDWVVVDCGRSDWLMVGPEVKAGQKIDCKTEFPHPNPNIVISKTKNSNMTDIYQGGNILLTEIYVDGKYGQLITHLKPNGDLVQQEVYLKYPNFFYMIRLWNKDSKETFDQILSTFKFTK